LTTDLAQVVLLEVRWVVLAALEVVTVLGIVEKEQLEVMVFAVEM